jgi:hypothetical protein
MATIDLTFSLYSARSINGSMTRDQTPPTINRNKDRLPDLSSRPPPPTTTIPQTSTFLPPPAQEDIRLCTINKADPNDTSGIELNYHRKEQFHSLTISPGRNDGPSSKSSVLTPNHCVMKNTGRPMRRAHARQI